MTKVHDYCLELLSARAYTTQALRRKLRQKGFDNSETEDAITKLTSSGLLDDARYAAEFARQRLLFGGASARRVEQDLARKGVERTVARAQTQQVIEEESIDPYESMEKVARKKALSFGDLDMQIKRRRLFGFLARKGYELDDIKRLLATLFP